MIFTGATLLTLAGLLRWSSMTTSLARRNNQVGSASAAAEAAVEKVVAQMSEDFQQGGETRVSGNLLNYRQGAPTPQESDFWSSYEFSDGQGHVNQTIVDLLPIGRIARRNAVLGLRGMRNLSYHLMRAK
jgi:hypothetical protein